MQNNEHSIPTIDWRKEKAYFAKHHGPVYYAYLDGQYAAWRVMVNDARRLKNTRLRKYTPVNPYPPGRRHNEWQRGFDGDVGQ